MTKLIERDPYLVLAGVFLVAIFVVDLMMAPNIIVEILYCPIVALSWLGPTRHSSLVIAATGTLLLLGGLVFAIKYDIVVSIANQGLVMLSMWLTAGSLWLDRSGRPGAAIARAALAESEGLLKAVVDTAVDGIITIDDHGIVSRVNPAVSRLFGYEREEMVGQNIKMLMPEPYHSAHDGYLTHFLDTGEARIIGIGREVEGRRKDGSTFAMDLAVSEVKVNGQKLFAGIVRDVSERKAAEARYQHLALHDPLTGLPNRRLFDDRLAQALAAAKRNGRVCALLMIDIDRFKEINDTLGHAAGDELLVMLAERLVSTLRATDTVARLGGDEFAIIQADLGPADSTSRLARRIGDAVARPCPLTSGEVSVTASIGIALCPSDTDRQDDLMRFADLALYAAKREGRRTHRFFEHELDQTVRSQRRLETELERAIFDNQLRLYYQPQYELGSDRLTGVEALVRWQHPERGLIGPAEFIPIAEASGLIRPLGDWVLMTACRQASEWSSTIRPINMAVNISGAQMAGQRLLPSLETALSLAGLDPHQLELEITETVLLEVMSEKIGSCLSGASARGIVLSIDDFGVGFGSLTYLRVLPVQKIKIDRSFIAGIDQPGGSGSERLVQAIINMAHSLDKIVVAEGVETERQLDLLRRFGCDRAQGFFFGRPVPAPALETLLAA